MTTTDDTALEQVARALDPYCWEKRDEWADPGHPSHGLRDNVVSESLADAARVLPVVRAEVAKARAEAWDEGYRAERKFSGTRNPYRTEQNDG